MSSKKRNKKGIESIEKQISLHKEKLRKAEEDDNIGLVNYYEKELEHFEQAINKKKRQLNRKRK